MHVYSLKELKEGLIDAGTDTIATIIPFVPAGGTKVARMAEKVNDGKQTSGKMLGVGGTKVNSQTVGSFKGGGRIDVENPAPGKKPGQIHYQNGDSKYTYNVNTNSFHIGKDSNGTLAPKNIQNLLKNKTVTSAIQKGLNILGVGKK